MALISCPECGKEISDKALSCPNCGNPINQQNQQEEYLCCPKCGSRELHAEHKGFSGGKALAGAVLTGGIGLLAGTIGSKDTQITCLKCGNKFNAGEARIIRPNQNVSEEENQLIGIIQSQGKITAVKWYKEKHGCGLAEAKDYVDSFAVKHNVLNGSGSGSGCAILILIGLSATLGAFLL